MRKWLLLAFCLLHLLSLLNKRDYKWRTYPLGRFELYSVFAAVEPYLEHNPWRVPASRVYFVRNGVIDKMEGEGNARITNSQRYGLTLPEIERAVANVESYLHRSDYDCLRIVRLIYESVPYPAPVSGRVLREGIIAEKCKNKISTMTFETQIGNSTLRVKANWTGEGNYKIVGAEAVLRDGIMEPQSLVLEKGMITIPASFNKKIFNIIVHVQIGDKVEEYFSDSISLKFL